MAASKTALSELKPCTMHSLEANVKTAMRKPPGTFARYLHHLLPDMRLVLRRRIQGVE